MALNSYLRLATSASLIALGGIAGIGALSLLLPSDIEKQVVARSDAPEPPTPCAEQSWLRLDRNCLSRRDLPWMSGHGTPSTTTFEPARPAATAPSATVAQSQGTPTTPVLQKAAPQNSAPPDAAPSEPAQQSNVSVPATPAAAERRAAKPAEAQGSEQDTPTPTRWRSARRPAAKARSVASAASDDEEREPTPKKTFRRDRVAKTPTRMAAKPSSKVVAEDESDDTPKRARKPSNRNALNAVRRFGDSLPDVPVDAYAGDGTRRKVIIRPTSIQDYYYYSVPR
jgi:hypothetical protein